MKKNKIKKNYYKEKKILLTARFELAPFRIGALIQRLGPTRPRQLFLYI